MLKLRPKTQRLGAVGLANADHLQETLEALQASPVRRLESLDDLEAIDVVLLGVRDLADLQPLVSRAGTLPPVIAALLADPPSGPLIEACLEAGVCDVLAPTASPAEVRARALAARRYQGQRGRAGDLDRALHAANREKLELSHRLRSARAELDRARGDVREHERLATVGTFAAGIAHQINNPLTGVVGFGELLLERDLPEDVLRDLSKVVEEAKRAARIIREMLDLTRTCTRNEIIDLGALLQRTIHLPQIERSLSQVHVIPEIAEPAPLVRGDAFRLQQVFQNLLENAVHALEEHAGQDRRVVVSAQDDGRVTMVKVADSGPGVAADNQKQLFQAFFTTKRSRERRGTGLGLAVCRSIVREHGGDIFYETSPLGGACFCVRLPAVGREEQAA